MRLSQEGEGSVTPEGASLEKQIFEIENLWKNIPEFQVDPELLKHMAIICDGNRRSAKEKNLAPYLGHRLGLEAIRGIMNASKDWGIRHLTFWTWSTENWKRDENQISFVMGLAAKYLCDEETTSPLIENEVRFQHLGRVDRLPSDVVKAIADLEERTATFNKYYVNLALDYGGLDEIGRAVARIIESGLKSEEVTDNFNIIHEYLDTAGQPRPDLVIRTGVHEGEIPHTSGFMPIQTAYSGWMFLPDLFPDLAPEKLLATVQKFTSYERRKGR